MNHTVTSKETILRLSRELVWRHGWSKLSIRSVAAQCGVSVGSVYRHFDSKAELVSAVTESIWREIFHRAKDEPPFEDICECIIWMYAQMEHGSRQYPDFFSLHSMGVMREDMPDGRQRMQETWRHISDGLSAVLRRDAQVRPDAFSGDFSAEGFAGILFSLMLSSLMRRDYDPAPVLELVSRTVY